MRDTLLRLAYAFLAISLLTQAASGQVITGIPPFASMSPSTFDTVNNANLNVHVEIPIFSRAGRGIPFSYVLSYDSSIWVPYTSTGYGAWTPVGQTSSNPSNWGWRGVTEAEAGYATYQSTWAYCHNSQNMPYPVYSPFVYNDPAGTPHVFPITITPGIRLSGARPRRPATP